MQTSNLESAIKGVYKHKQIDGFLMAREYIFLKENGKKCLLQRFYNETAATLTDVEFDLIELDINGRVIQRRPFAYHGLSIRPDEWFVLPEGIVVSSDCVDFKFARLSVASWKYVYRIKRGNVQTYYDRRRGERFKRVSYFEDLEWNVSSQTPRFKGLYSVTGLLALFLSVAAALHLLLQI